MASARANRYLHLYIPVSSLPLLAANNEFNPPGLRSCSRFYADKRTTRKVYGNATTRDAPAEDDAPTKYDAMEDVD